MSSDDSNILLEEAHVLKCESPHFEEIAMGNRTFEIRKNDRGFRVGDWICLRWWMTKDGEEPRFGDLSINAQVSSILQDYDGLEWGFCIMSLSRVSVVQSYPGGFEAPVSFKLPPLLGHREKERK